MAGTVLRLLPRTDFNFSNVQGIQNVVLWVNQNIDVSRYREATLLVRAHALTIGAGASLPVVIRGVLPSDEDPGQFFRAPNDFVAVTPTSAPALFVGVFPANFGGYVSLMLRPTQPVNPATITATLSIDLSLKD